MKNNKLITALLLIISVICLVFSASCQNPSEQTSSSSSLPSSSGSDGSSEHKHDFKKVEEGNAFTLNCDCGEVAKGYRIQFIFAEDGSQADSGIEVSWIDKNGNEFTAKTNDLGYVEALSLAEDSYKIEVNEETLPQINGVSYFYDTNLFSQQENGVGFTIPLFSAHQPQSTGEFYFNEVAYQYNVIELNKNYVATLKSANDMAWYALVNDGIGKYTIDASSAEGFTVELDRYFGYIEMSLLNTTDTDADKSEKGKLTYKVVFSDDKQTSNFCIKVPDASSYPINVSFNVSITYRAPNANVGASTLVKPTRFETESAEYVYYTEERGSSSLIENKTASLLPVDEEKWQDEEGSVIKDLSETQFEQMSLRDDGFYYANNQLVFVKLDAPSIFGSLTLAGYLYGSSHLDIYMITEYDEYGCCTLWNNYFGFVQAYTALSNSDGLYPLTNEMLDFLTIVAKKEHSSVSSLLCTYPMQLNNWTRGNGSQSNPYGLFLSEQAMGNYSVSIPEGGKAYVTLAGTMDVVLTFNSTVKATYNVSYDEYLAVDGTVKIEFETKDGSALEFILNVDEYNDPYYLEIGENRVSAVPNAELSHEFIAPESGNFDVSISSLTAKVTVKQDGKEDVIITDTTTFALNEGESIVIIVETESEEEEFLIDVQRALE